MLGLHGVVALVLVATAKGFSCYIGSDHWANGGATLNHLKQKGAFTTWVSELGIIMGNEVNGSPTNELVQCQAEQDACVIYGFTLELNGRKGVQTAFACTKKEDLACNEWHSEESVYGGEVSFFCETCGETACNDPGASGATSAHAASLAAIAVAVIASSLIALPAMV
jgi:hypothetical protein